MMDNRLPRCERLRGKSAISQLFDKGRGGFVYPFRYVWLCDKIDAEPTAEVLFTVPKRFHKRANKRNLLRRRCKEGYRLQSSILLASEQRGGYRLALIYSSKEVEEYDVISKSVAKILNLIANE